MDDLAGLVLSQLQVADGTSPYALLYMEEYGYRVLIAKVARVNGSTLFEYAYVDLHEGPAWKARQNNEQPVWEFVAFTDVQAAVYFGLAFLNKDYQAPGNGYVMQTMRVEDVEDMFERNATGALVPQKFQNGFATKYMQDCIGKRVILNEAMLQAGLGSLLPVSRVSG
tara:strand:+ start:139 stop:642 length:504 start_codon:yes stop_codon:yes gene_type:complete